MTPEHMMVKTADVVNGSLWRIFPVLNVDFVSDIPSDYPGAMAVPITFIFHFDPSQFELLGQTPAGARLESGRKPYRRLVIRHLHPELPEEIDLVTWFDRMGRALDVQFIHPEELPEDAMLLYCDRTEVRK